MEKLRTRWQKPRAVRRFVAVLCFVLGLLAGWLLGNGLLERWSGLNL